MRHDFKFSFLYTVSDQKLDRKAQLQKQSYSWQQQGIKGKVPGNPPYHKQLTGQEGLVTMLIIAMLQWVIKGEVPGKPPLPTATTHCILCTYEVHSLGNQAPPLVCLPRQTLTTPMVFPSIFTYCKQLTVDLHMVPQCLHWYTSLSTQLLALLQRNTQKMQESIQ